VQEPERTPEKLNKLKQSYANLGGGESEGDDVPLISTSRQALLAERAEVTRKGGDKKKK
jgi:hypothetical protein